ncbi:RNA-binding cell elongation regulator Jag/EloR [Aedoeadaptatus pacaensis]|uniref:RNA-binding cell elongation regulator Jag/EloR n=1 Tax=Aedoeadaptatus pacaensis TaxID=1776390 RepID=UPI000837D4D7|nr:RNA-binding cell elongation regulator Jag/EloR [Peptoniphilus pacaensis]
MNFSIQSAKTVDEAVEKALLELKATRDEVDIEVIEEPSGGFLGLIGGKDAIVKVRRKMDHKDIVDSILKDEEIESVRSVLDEKAKEEAAAESEEEAEVPEADEVEEENEQAEDATQEPAFEYLNDEELEDLIREYIDRIMSAIKLGYTLSVDFNENEIFVSIDGKREETGIIIGKHGSTLNGIQIVLSAMVNQRSEEFRRVIVDCSGYRKRREQVLKRIAGKTANKVLKTNKSIKLEPMNAQERRIIHACLANVDGIRTRSEGKEPHRRVVIHKDTSQPS